MGSGKGVICQICYARLLIFLDELVKLFRICWMCYCVGLII